MNHEMLQGWRCSYTLLEPEASSWERRTRDLVSICRYLTIKSKEQKIVLGAIWFICNFLYDETLVLHNLALICSYFGWFLIILLIISRTNIYNLIIPLCLHDKTNITHVTTSVFVLNRWSLRKLNMAGLNNISPVMLINSFLICGWNLRWSNIETSSLTAR